MKEQRLSKVIEVAGHCIQISIARTRAPSLKQQYHSQDSSEAQIMQDKINGPNKIPLLHGTTQV